MLNALIHATHPDLIGRVNRAQGHLRPATPRIEADPPRTRVAPWEAPEWEAPEKAAPKAGRVPVHGPAGPLVGHGAAVDLAPSAALAKLV